MSRAGKKSCVVAFSGGLDTSFLVPYLRETYGFGEIITCTVNTGGFSEDDVRAIEIRSKEIGADKHVTLSGEKEYYSDILRYLIAGNVSRDGYPLCVGAERLIQGVKVLEVCKRENASAVAHGSTGAGNDQYRFDLVAHVLGEGSVECIAPVREMGFSREYETEYLGKKGISIPEKKSVYSYNVGLWGVSIGGRETHSSTSLLPEDAWYSKVKARPGEELSIEIVFEQGELLKIHSKMGNAEGAVPSIKLLGELGSYFGVGRHYHIGTSIPGKKGRIGYESPAADIIYEAHRTLERITLSQAQIAGKRVASDEFGKLVHEAKFFDPYIDDLRALLVSSQRYVTGTCRVQIAFGKIQSVLADSPYNLLSVSGAVYGEGSDFYSGKDAEGACKLNAFEQYLVAQKHRSANS